MTRQRTVYLDVIRIIACLMVIVMHSPMTGEGAAAHGAFLVVNSYLTAPCVPLFFMVSGALLLPCGEGSSAAKYLRKRLGKIVGPTICFTLFYIALNNLDRLNAHKLVISILSMPFSTQGNGVLWFMYTLTGLYLLVPLLSPWLRATTKREIELYLALWFITLLYPYLSLILQVNTGDTGALYYFTGFAGYFLLGHYMRRYGLPLKWLTALSLIVLPLPALDKFCGWGLDFYTAFWYLSAPVAVMTATWFALIRKFMQPIVLNSAAATRLAAVSNLSFGIYLIHIFIMRSLLWNWSVIRAIGNYYLQTALIAALTFVGAWAICSIISRLPLARYIIGYSAHKRLN